MRKQRINKAWGLVVLATLALSACDNEVETISREFTFNATMEQLQNADNNGAKVQLVNEEWTYWELYDSISLASNASLGSSGTPQINGTKTLYSGWLVNPGSSDYSDYNGVFISTLTEVDGAPASTWFVGIHPANYKKHIVTYTGDDGSHGFKANVYLDSVQHYRHDSSYARQLLPMIATYDGPQWGPDPGQSPDPPRLDFHSLAGLVRLQLVNSTGSNTAITKIELKSLDFASAPDSYDGDKKRPLCGRFQVDSLYRFNAYLKRSSFKAPKTLPDNGNGDGYTLILDMDGSLEFNQNDLKSFYIVLPAFHGMDLTTNYRLQMKVYNAAGQVCTKTFNAHTRRNGITYLRAIDITAFNESAGTGTPTIVGNGTSTRPFKIYTLADLVYVRDRFNAPDPSGNVYINGQRVTSNTWFRIMRSDITLTTGNWDTSITNFVGHMTYYSTAAHALHGITNQSCRPIFTSIANGGVVSGLTVITNSILNFNDNSPRNEADYSPLCSVNNGVIEDCRNISPVGLELEKRPFFGKVGANTCYAGICITNNGTIRGSSCAVLRTFENSSNFAGICKVNTGTIQGCMLTAPVSVTGAVNGAGVCYTNNNMVKDCYCEVSYYSTPMGATNWGGIVYQNSGGLSATVQNCYVSANSIIHTSGNLGGIVCINNGATVENCHNLSTSLLGMNVGGIVATLEAGLVRNCFVDDSAMFITLYNTSGSHYAGGIVAVQNGGDINNCYTIVKHIVVNALDATGKYGALVGYMSTASAHVNNCYALEVDAATPQFYGTKTAGTLTYCHLVGGTQDGVDGITTINTENLATLLTSLNGHIPSGGFNWTRGTLTGNPDYDKDRAPSLSLPASSKKHLKRK